jgi:tellurite methyltransferase
VPELQATNVEAPNLNRPIASFRLDDEGDWVAELSCGHGRHCRHDPPFLEREWVTTEAGRAARIGTDLDCVCCDRAEMPADHAPYQRTPTFSETSVPKGLLANHTTKAGVWGLIHIEQGRLEYCIEGSGAGPAQLVPGSLGIVLPEVEHRVRPIGPVAFHVEFWRKRS